MKEIMIKTTATATVEETWTAEVPDDFDLDDQAAVECLIYDGQAELLEEDKTNTFERLLDGAEWSNA